MISDKKIIEDCGMLVPFIEEAAKHDKGLPSHLSFRYMSCNIKRKPTKKTPTGREPKYALECMVDVFDMPAPSEDLAYAIPEEELNRPRDTLIIHLSYTKTGKIGKSKIYAWQNRVCHIFFLSESKGELSISKIAAKGLNEDAETVLYKRGDKMGCQPSLK